MSKCRSGRIARAAAVVRDQAGARAPAAEPPRDQRRLDRARRDDQDRLAGEVRRRERRVGRLGARQRHGEAEGRALARRALDRERAAHALDDAARDREPEAGAAELARRAAVGLLELLEDARLRVRRDADAGVAHQEADFVRLRRPARRSARRRPVR